jgi:hypothetical protein
MHAARTKWEYLITHAIKADRSVDDLTMILERDSGARVGSGEVMTALDHWMSKYTRP